MKRIMIDIGHGGSDAGAAANGLVEKDLNLKVGLKLREMLSWYEVDVRMTRDKDIDLSADQRVKLVNDFNPDLCVSVHHNAAAASARGAEVIHAHYDKEDDALAVDILQRLSLLGMPTRRAFTKLNESGSDWYFMIRRIWDNDTDAIITEGGFVTNTEDAKLLKAETFLKGEAEAIGSAIVKHLGLKPKTVIEATNSNSVPKWQQDAFVALVGKGTITTPSYWENRLDKNITVGEIMGILNNLK
ncbi:N-acetylmuramoyl-L-alanine amidase family protein [Anaerosolibacter sp.]|uniref:N-acetylmuramoyl-L-alanine amidase family protein n=1 Tax=Anaerosolibacter sp. TaxID=1872527 RepID=UPI0039EF710A